MYFNHHVRFSAPRYKILSRRCDSPMDGLWMKTMCMKVAENATIDNGREACAYQCCPYKWTAIPTDI